MQPGRDLTVAARRSLYYAQKRLAKRGVRTDRERLDLQIAAHCLRQRGLREVAVLLQTAAGEPEATSFGQSCFRLAGASQAMVEAAEAFDRARLKATTFAQAPGLLWGCVLVDSERARPLVEEHLLEAIRAVSASGRLAQLTLLADLIDHEESLAEGRARMTALPRFDPATNLLRATVESTGFAYDPSVAAALAIMSGADSATLLPDRRIDRSITRPTPALAGPDIGLVPALLDLLTPPDLDGWPLELTDDMYELRVSDVLNRWLEALVGIAAEVGAPLVQLMPWPAGFDSALSIRFDVDRPASPTQVARLLHTMSEELGAIPATWYCIPGLDHEARALPVLQQANQELGVHCREPEEARAGMGITCHSAPTSRYWLGARHLAEAERRGADHAELLTALLDVPGPVWLATEKRATKTLATPLLFPLEGSTADSDLSFFNARIDHFRSLLGRGGHAIISTHNDIEPSLLAEVLKRERAEGMWIATVGDVVRRIRELRTPGTVVFTGRGLRSSVPIKDVVIRTHLPSGRVDFSCDLSPNADTALGMF
ncbi:hypothetical protein [Euzebya pacifica]|nr:hypothetical protein [Euzebya pacifica]